MSVRRVITEDLPPDVEAYYWWRGFWCGVGATVILLLFSLADGWHITKIVFFGGP